MLVRHVVCSRSNLRAVFGAHVMCATDASPPQIRRYARGRRRHLNGRRAGAQTVAAHVFPVLRKRILPRDGWPHCKPPHLRMALPSSRRSGW
eukprot:SAG31_NODE_23902_length_493_cov_0.786802_1_plen_91_part_01